MKKGDYISTVLRSRKTVFSFKDLCLLWGDPGAGAMRTRVNYYVKKGDLYPIRKGLYAKDTNYDRLELSTRIFTPAYISFETVLAQAGINFQYYHKIFVASYLTREIVVDSQIYAYKRIKDLVLTNPAGVENKGNYAIATSERAILDTLYVNADYHFDNMSSFHWDKIFEILPMYRNKRMERKVNEFYKYYKATK